VLGCVWEQESATFAPTKSHMSVVSGKHCCDPRQWGGAEDGMPGKWDNKAETDYSSRPPVPPIILGVPSRVYRRAVVRITIAELFRLERETSIRNIAS